MLFYYIEAILNLIRIWESALDVTSFDLSPKILQAGFHKFVTMH